MNTNQTSTPAPATPAIQHLWITTDRTFCGAEVDIDAWTPATTAEQDQVPTCTPCHRRAASRAARQIHQIRYPANLTWDEHTAQAMAAGNDQDWEFGAEPSEPRAVVRWQARFPPFADPSTVTYDYAATRAGDGLWYVTGPRSLKGGRTWEDLVGWLDRLDVTQFERLTS